MFKKYFTMSFDDGLEQDKRLIELLDKYGLKATFNLNSGCFGNNGSVLRIGDMGFLAVREPVRFPALLFQRVDQHRIPRDEITQVYRNHEVATHSVSHSMLTRLSQDALRAEIINDQQALSALVGYDVVGHAYPFGMSNDAVIQALKDAHLTYGRTVKSTNSFTFPQNPLVLNPTCSIISGNILELSKKFISTEVTEDMLFYVWGHTYELDYGTSKASWHLMEEFCELIAGHGNIVYCSNRDALAKC